MVTSAILSAVNCFYMKCVCRLLHSLRRTRRFCDLIKQMMMTKN